MVYFCFVLFNLYKLIIINNYFILFLISRERALLSLIALATGILPDQANLNLTHEAMIIFDNITEDLLTNEEQFANCGLQYNYLPQFFIEWVICRAWFLYLTMNVQTCVAMLKDVIVKIQNIIKLKSYPENQ